MDYSIEITGEKLLAKRKALNWTQIEAANFIGVDRVTISNYEKDAHKIKKNNIPKLIEFLELPEMGLCTFKKLQSGYYSIKVPFVAVNEIQKFIDTKELIDTTIEYIMRDEIIGSYIAFEVPDDSMKCGNTVGIKRGDIALVKQINKLRFVNELNLDAVWVIMLDNEIIVKKIERFDTNTNEIICYSLNKSINYNQIISLKLNEVRNIYKVVQVTTSDI